MNTPTPAGHSPELMACPLCGKPGELRLEDAFINGEEDWAVHCEECPASVRGLPTESDAVLAWNTRAPSRGGAPAPSGPAATAGGAFRDALIACGRACGAAVSAACSDQFLLMIPDEVQGTIERLTRDKDHLLTQADGDYLRTRLAEMAGLEKERDVAVAKHAEVLEWHNNIVAIAEAERDQARAEGKP